MSAALAVAPVTVPADTLPDQRRLTESDPDFVRLHNRTQRRLMASIRQVVRDAKAAQVAPVTQRSGMLNVAVNSFVQRHLQLLKQAYEDAHVEGQIDYWHSVSAIPGKQQFVSADTQTLRRRLAFYAPSVAKMAREVAQIVSAPRAPRIAVQHATEASNIAFLLADLPPTLNDYADSVAPRVVLQAQVTWPAMNDGYIGAGVADPANPYAEVWWNLDPGAKQHCNDCPDFAAASPYTAPGAGGNELTNTPGDGTMECGAACKCSLSYDMPAVGPELTALQQAIGDTWQNFLPSDQPLPVPVLTKDAVPVAARGERLRLQQIRQLDKFRQATADWNAVRGELPEAPAMFEQHLTTDTVGLPAWETLTAEQQAVITRMEQSLDAWMTVTGVAVPEPIFHPDPLIAQRAWLEAAGRGEFTPWWKDYVDPPNPSDVNKAWFEWMATLDWPDPQLPDPHAELEAWLNWASQNLAAQKAGTEITTDFRGSEQGKSTTAREIDLPTIKLINNYPRQAGGRFGFGPGTVTSGGSGHAGAGNSTRASTHMSSGERQARLQQAASNRLAADARFTTATSNFNTVANEYHAANDKYEIEKARLQGIETNLKAGARDQIIEDGKTRAPKTYEKYTQAKATYEDSKAKQDAIDVYGAHGPFATQREIREQVNNQYESEHNGQRISSYRQYNQAMRDSGRAEEYQHAQSQIDEYSRQNTRMYNSQRSMQRYENQLVGNRINNSDLIYQHPSYLSQKATTDEAQRVRDEAKARWTQSNTEMNAARSERETYSNQVDLLSRSGQGITYNSEGRQAVSNVFGHDLNEDEVRQLAGANGDDIVTIGAYDAHDNTFALQMESVDGEREANFTVSRRGNQIIISDPTVRNRGEANGAATDIVSSFDDMKALGASKLTASAARMSGGRQSGFNGYYTWARLGFTGKIPDSVLPQAQSVFGSHVTRVEQIMRQGRRGWTWWKANGTTWDATFSFKDGSYSMRTLNAWRRAVSRNG